MRILAIESSCDETAMAIVECSQLGFKVLSNRVASQIASHQVFGGVVPEIAAREHFDALDVLFKAVLGDASIAKDELTEKIDAVAVTQGPGLIGALLVGISFAKGLALRIGKPLIPVDHVHGHIHGAFLGLDESICYPFLSLVVSGGHTNLYLVKDAGSYSLVAFTIDDACGECFDKVGKMIGLKYPAGAVIEKMAEGGDPSSYSMPKPVPEKTRLEFSFSGLKTHMSKLLNGVGATEKSGKIRDILASFQFSCFDQLLRKVETSIEKYDNITCLVVAGGVAANRTFREMAADRLVLKCHFPDLRFCSDNAAMIAVLAYESYQLGDPSSFSSPFLWDGYPRYDFLKYMLKT